jgi:hypothetical protein
MFNSIALSGAFDKFILLRCNYFFSLTIFIPPDCRGWSIFRMKLAWQLTVLQTMVTWSPKLFWHLSMWSLSVIALFQPLLNGLALGEVIKLM